MSTVKKDYLWAWIVVLIGALIIVGTETYWILTEPQYQEIPGGDSGSGS